MHKFFDLFPPAHIFGVMQELPGLNHLNTLNLSGLEEMGAHRSPLGMAAETGRQRGFGTCGSL